MVKLDRIEKKEAKPGKEEVKLVKAEDKARLHIPRSEAIKAPEEKTKVITEAKKVTTAEPDVAKEKIFAAKKAPEPEKEKISPPKKVTQEKTEEKLSRVKDAEHEKAKPKSPTTPSLKDLPTSKEEKQLLKDRPLSTHHPSIHSASKHTYPEHQPSKMLLSDKTQPQKTDSEKHEKITHSPKAEKVLVPEKKAAPKEGKPKAEDLTTSKQSSTMRYFQCVFVDGNNGYHTGFPFPMLNPNPQSLKRETRAPGH
ncbi:triadin-like [Polypterus senegalus]|uniref:triadin-like n=1 Tax=Polypterus senegalus TaxID=55291 RepID=UPI001964C5AD|nr:triadin-like [Polypterus senegalus]